MNKNLLTNIAFFLLHKPEIFATQKNKRPYTYVCSGGVDNGCMVGDVWLLNTQYAQSSKIDNFHLLYSLVSPKNGVEFRQHLNGYVIYSVASY